MEMPGAGSGGAGGRHRRGRVSRDARRGRHRTWGERLVLTLGCVSALALGASAAGLGYVYRKYERLPRVELSGVLDEASDSGGPENYLVVGIESAENLEPDDPVRIGRNGAGKSDTIMILRIDPRERGAKLLSLPRDLWVPIAGTGHSRKINAAVEIGGAPLLIRTIDENFGIDIHHYVQVDFAAFRGLVEAIDGVPIYFPYPARDRKVGLDIRRSGCVTLDPVQALAFVRSRTYEQLIDGEWDVDMSLPDIGRIGRQQAFIRKALSRASERGARNPGTLDRLIDVGLDGITVDQALTAGDLFDLGRRFRSFDPENLETYSLDVAVSPDEVNDADILRLDERVGGADLRPVPGSAPVGECGRGRYRPGVGPPPGAQRHWTAAARQRTPDPPSRPSASASTALATIPSSATTAPTCSTRLARRRRPTCWRAGWREAPSSRRSRARTASF